jgi:membrane fusion protein (multidrug efflux system)
MTRTTQSGRRGRAGPARAWRSAINILLRAPRASACVLGATLVAAGCEPQGAPPAPPPLSIAVVEAVARDVPVTLELVGQTRGSVDIPIRARVEGFLESLEFVEGGQVSAGQQLYTIDPRPFEARVVEARGRVAEARTLLAKSKADLDRIRPLAEMRAVSEQDLDGAQAQYDAAVGNLQAAEAQLDQAEIELSYTVINSPIDGRIGISAAKVGEFVGREPNPVVLNYVSQADPIRVRFAINERDYLRLARQVSDLRSAQDQFGRRSSGSAEGEASQDEGRSLQLILADGSVHSYPGKVVGYDAAINPTTGTFTIEADFPNPGGIVLAGQFARVRAVVEERKDAVLIPQRAVSELQGIFRAFVVDDDNVAKLRTLELGPAIGNLRIVESGVEAGERVAVEGLLRLTNDALVDPRVTTMEELTKGAGD